MPPRKSRFYRHGGRRGTGGVRDGSLSGVRGKNPGPVIRRIPGVTNLRRSDDKSATFSPKCDQSEVRDTYWTENIIKLAGFAPPPAATPGMTANAPAMPPGMQPQTPQGPGLPPPNGGAPVPTGMGSPSLDPNTGQPMPPPGALAGQPGGAKGGVSAPGGAQDPSQAGAPPAPPQNSPVDPLTGQPVTSPMQDPPPPVLPANPQMHPPRAANMADHQSANIMGSNTGNAAGASPGSLLGMKAQAENPMSGNDAADDMRSEAMAMGSKTADDMGSNLAMGALPAMGAYCCSGSLRPQCRQEPR